MKIISFLLAVFVTSFMLISCGGSGGSAPSPFQGTFAGNWISDGPDVGNAQITITPGGHIGGTENDTTISLSGTVNGSIHSNGTFTGTVTPNGGSPVSASGSFSISQDSNTLSGSVVFGGVTYTYTLSRTV
jgi:hypothetical protein